MITDNGRFSLSAEGFGESDECNLRRISDRSIADLCLENPDLLIFPESLQSYGDEIGTAKVCTLSAAGIETYNTVGFIGIGDTQLTIRSRFAKNGGEDYFLHYMLQRVFSVNMFDLDHSHSDDPVFDFLTYLFPHFLKRAVGQGLFRQYSTREYDDANVRGPIDIARMLRTGIPFRGRIAYRTREYGGDNPITQLVRHTVEYISADHARRRILQSDPLAADCASRIRTATPTYSPEARRRIVELNLRPTRHPYYTEYTGLQRLCVRILRHKGLKYGSGGRKIHGLLFDSAWLWEEYLASILAGAGFVHPHNRTGRQPIRLFTSGGYPRYPDFYRPGESVLDAKYKFRKDGIGRDDLHQLLAYMYVERAGSGGLIYPNPAEPADCRVDKKFVGTLRGYGGGVSEYMFPVPGAVSGFREFCEAMRRAEESLRALFPYAGPARRDAAPTPPCRVREEN